MRTLNCPRCGRTQTRTKPRTLEQLLWGGSTCPECSTEVDKWGREVSTANRGPGLAASRTAKTIIGLLVVGLVAGVNIRYDYSHPLGILTDAAIIIIALIWYLTR
jgi:hypothetical protein